jgi:uncharacterized protein (TIGR03067 family)
MRRIMMAFLSATLLAAVSDGGDLNLLQGTWNLILFDTKARTLAFEGSRIIIDKNGFIEIIVKKSTGFIKFHSVDGIKIFERTLEGQSQEKKSDRGIFRLEGGTFWQCSISGSDMMIPDDFSSIKGSRQVLRVWKRMGRADVGLANKEEDALVGTWRLDSETIDGKRIDEEITKGYTLAVEAGGRFTIRSEMTVKGIVRVDESKTPKQIDFEPTYPDITKGFNSSGIYQLDGNQFTIDRNFRSYMPRPTEFGPSQKTSTHSIYERGKP